MSSKLCLNSFRERGGSITQISSKVKPTELVSFWITKIYIFYRRAKDKNDKIKKVKRKNSILIFYLNMGNFFFKKEKNLTRKESFNKVFSSLIRDKCFLVTCLWLTHFCTIQVKSAPLGRLLPCLHVSGSSPFSCALSLKQFLCQGM